MGVNINTIRILDKALKDKGDVSNYKLALIGDLYMRGPGFKHRRANGYFRQFWKEVLSFDINGSADRNVDLSKPLPFQFINRFDVLINGGTAEHVDNQKQFWENCDKMVVPGGVMIHVAPEVGSFPGHSETYYDLNFFTTLLEAFKYRRLHYERIKHRQGWAIYVAFEKGGEHGVS